MHYSMQTEKFADLNPENKKLPVQEEQIWQTLDE